MKDSYLWTSGLELLDMRLLVEGAIALYEDDGMPLFGLAMQSGQTEAADAFEAIGNALQSLRQHIRELQTACNEEMRQLSELAKEL